MNFTTRVAPPWGCCASRLRWIELERGCDLRFPSCLGAFISCEMKRRDVERSERRRVGSALGVDVA